MDHQQIFSVLLACGLSFSVAAEVIVDFESVTPGTTYGESQGNTAGELLFSQNGIDVFYVSGTSRGSSQIGGWTDTYFDTTSFSISNNTFRFVPPSIAGANPTSVSFEYFDGGGVSGIRVNENVSLIPFTNNPSVSTPAGNISVTATSGPFSNGVKGIVTVSGPILSLSIYGQELGVDNITFVPEPSSLALLGFGGLALVRRRR